MNNNYNKPVRSAKIPNGTVSVNVPKFTNQTKKESEFKIDRRMDKLKRITSFSLAIILAGGMFVLGRKTAKTEVYLPDEYVMTNVEMPVDKGLIEPVCRQYYDQSYTSVYPTFTDYTKSVEALNDVKAEALQDDQLLLFPIIFHKSNSHYINKMRLEKELFALERSNDYWIDYTYGSMDTISHLAALASLDDEEVIYKTREILNKNNYTYRDAGFIREGTVIKIINPKVGELKMAIQEEHEALLESTKALGYKSQNR